MNKEQDSPAIRIEQNEKQTNLQETEVKLRPHSPENFDAFRTKSKFLTQVYLSHPSEAYNLRVRETLTSDGAASYTATLKDAGTITDGAKQRLEIETDISPDTFAYYAAQEQFPKIQKQRAKIIDGMTIDWFENGDTLIEIEDTARLLDAFAKGVTVSPEQYENVSDDPLYDNESRAHSDYFVRTGSEALLPPATSIEQLALTALQEITAHQITNTSSVITISGRSGSGKSTLSGQIIERIQANSPTVEVVTLSTDDYHRGKAWLDRYNNGEPWSDWDNEVVYDLAALSDDIAALQQGESIDRRSFNFSTQETERAEKLTPSPIIIVEGIYAGAQCLQEAADLSYEIPTPLATCIGQRIARDRTQGRINESLSNPQDILRYLLENAEPTYQKNR